MTGKITVANKYSGATGVNIMRGTPLGNPYPLNKKVTREMVIDEYRIWLREQYAQRRPAGRELIRLARLVQKGHDLTLVCCCAPKACHGDVVKEAILGIVKKWATPPPHGSGRSYKSHSSPASAPESAHSN